jgi:hypothetical protein
VVTCFLAGFYFFKNETENFDTLKRKILTVWKRKKRRDTNCQKWRAFSSIKSNCIQGLESQIFTVHLWNFNNPCEQVLSNFNGQPFLSIELKKKKINNSSEVNEKILFHTFFYFQV